MVGPCNLLLRTLCFTFFYVSAILKHISIKLHHCDTEWNKPHLFKWFSSLAGSTERFEWLGSCFLKRSPSINEAVALQLVLTELNCSSVEVICPTFSIFLPRHFAPRLCGVQVCFIIDSCTLFWKLHRFVLSVINQTINHVENNKQINALWK